MLPAAVTSTPAVASTCATRPVVVVFPFVPVIAITRLLRSRHASSTSPMVRMPASTMRLRISVAGPIPGLTTMRSAARIRSTSC